MKKTSFFYLKDYARIFPFELHKYVFEAGDFLFPTL